MLESIGNLKVLITEIRAKLVIKDIRNKSDLLIGNKSIIEIIFVPFLSQNFRTNTTTRD
jgi:hypothetical protein